MVCLKQYRTRLESSLQKLQKATKLFKSYANMLTNPLIKKKTGGLYIGNQESICVQTLYALRDWTVMKDLY